MNPPSLRYPDIKPLPGPFPWRKLLARAFWVLLVVAGAVFVAVI